MNFYRIKLFIAGSQPNSQIMRRMVETICEKHIKQGYSLQIVDVLEDFRLALEHNVIVAPTLIIEEPPPPVRIVGCVKDPWRIMAILGIGEPEG